MEIKLLEKYKEKLQETKDKYVEGIKEAYEFAYPTQARYFEEERGEKPKVNYDSYAQKAVKVFTDGFIAMGFNPSINNFALSVRPDLMKKRSIKKVLREIEEDLVYTFSKSRAYEQSAWAVSDACIGGSGFTSVINNSKTGYPVYTRRHVAQIIIGVDTEGFVDTQFRSYKCSYEQLVSDFPKAVTPEITDKLNQFPLDEIEIIHAVLPKRSEVYFKDTFSKKFTSIYYTTEFGEDGGTILEEGYFNSFPYASFQMDADGFDWYGTGLCAGVISEIKLINQISKSEIEAAHYATRPAMNVPAEMEDINLNPGGINYYMDNERMIVPINKGERIDIAERAFDRRKNIIDDYLYTNFFQMLQQIDRPMTAFEVSQRMSEKGAQLVLLASTFQQTYLKQLIERTMEIRLENLAYNLPGELSGEEVFITHMSPMAQMQKRLYAEANVRNLMEFARIAAEYDPNAVKKINFGKILGELSGAYNINPDYIRSDEELAGEIQREQMMAMASQTADIQQKMNK